ncbi:MAG: hypothetical protein sL5_06930 [Candidatus Mesenet longicola]|uniref:Lipoprotein n=1 Tax=Candidatus Mesenet longicola TaxID=1892558 RepID=A0A8J3HV61_9RICK|nr:MAG: hypothetical protein sGL2_07310 [Candidatus Mesenet longicola]GHM59700.1 MAG: hypothetical protein sL5_06930 [Candidatus Mesenet longicola]
MIKWIILLIIIAIVIGVGCKWFYQWLSQSYFSGDARLKDVSSVDDKPSLDVRDKKFDNKKDLGKIPYDIKNKKSKLHIKSVKSALKNTKKGRNL